ncbi:M23 family metallopeptidase [Lysobacter profundi]|uniref:M23 family metallopeptidase n=1 Tax=Cognatiluteimonas profundi TaxID=2594501 RepID=UPI00131C90FA
MLLAPLIALALPVLASTDDTTLPPTVEQGALVLGHTTPGNQVSIGDRPVRVGGDGAFAFGVGRDEAGPLQVEIHRPDRSSQAVAIAVTARQWPIERIVGVPPATVNPPPAIAERIAREQAAVASARLRDDDRDDYEQAFQWPVQGRISGRFGNQRVYVLPDGSDAPKSPHSGMDIAAATGTPVLAPAPGVVTFVGPELYLTGGTVVLDHGHGISSNFLHLSRIDVRVGDRIAEGQRIGAVGATGRATGPHLHWGMNWFDVRIDPLLVLGKTP